MGSLIKRRLLLTTFCSSFLVNCPIRKPDYDLDIFSQCKHSVILDFMASNQIASRKQRENITIKMSQL